MIRIIGIDPGEICGMVVLDGGIISSVFNIMYEMLPDKITPFLLHSKCCVVIEDIRPYSLRLTPQVIWTCKLIGELSYRIKSGSGAIIHFAPRSDVKKWCFDTFPEVCIPLIQKKILKKGFMKKETGEPRKPSFVFVDDKIVTNCMKVLFSIEMPKSGYGYRFGLKDHSWQALAIAAQYHYKMGETSLECPQET